ncbi:hypothetical protein J6590_062326 [Homalodisca vitripennis]|nr:hypothetical protein J6590_062326 [Homalodisca vitripennis]
MNHSCHITTSLHPSPSSLTCLVNILSNVYLIEFANNAELPGCCCSVISKAVFPATSQLLSTLHQSFLAVVVLLSVRLCFQPHHNFSPPFTKFADVPSQHTE